MTKFNFASIAVTFSTSHNVVQLQSLESSRSFVYREALASPGHIIIPRRAIDDCLPEHKGQCTRICCFECIL